MKKIKDSIPGFWSKEVMKPIGHELVLVRTYKTLNEWFKDLCLDDKLSLYYAKIKMDSGHYITIKPIIYSEKKRRKEVKK